VENLASTGIRSPDRPARSQSLYRLSYPAHFSAVIGNRKFNTAFTTVPILHSNRPKCFTVCRIFPIIIFWNLLLAICVMVPRRYYYFCVVFPVSLMYSHIIHVKIYSAGKHLNYLWPNSIQYILDSRVVRLKQFSSASLYDGVIGS
jgi:hypothetical protein